MTFDVHLEFGITPGGVVFRLEWWRRKDKNEYSKYEIADLLESLSVFCCMPRKPAKPRKKSGTTLSVVPEEGA